jgi:hypothetical protein
MDMTTTKYKMSDEEKKWRAKDDAETLARAKEIRTDQQRHSAARDHVRSMVKAVGRPNGKRGK